MKTAEELFKPIIDEYMIYCECYTSERSFNSAKALMVKEIKEALTEHDKEIRDIIPSTFYAGLELEERLKMLVSCWQRAIEVNHQLQEENDKLRGNEMTKPETSFKNFSGKHLIYCQCKKCKGEIK